MTSAGAGEQPESSPASAATPSPVSQSSLAESPSSVPVRGALARTVLETMRDPEVRLVLLTGEAGVGKSHLLTWLAAQTHADRVWGTSALAEVPGSAFAHLIAPHSSASDLVRAALTQLGATVCVDDLDQCDPLSRAVLERLMRDPDRTVVASVRTVEGHLPPAVRELGQELQTAVIEVPRLSAEETRALVNLQLTGQLHPSIGETVEESVMTQVWDRCAGNALHTAQLLRSARSHGALVLLDGRWQGVAPFPAPPTLRAAVLAQITELPPRARTCAEWLAGIGKATLKRVSEAGHASDLGILVEAQLVCLEESPGPGTSPGSRTSEAPTVASFAHPLVAEVVWAEAGPLRRHEVLALHFALESAAHHPDRVRLAVLGLQVGEPVLADDLLTAARLATGSTDSDTALKLALAALPVSRGDVHTEAAALAADALMQRGRADEANDLLAEVLAGLRPGPQAILLAGLQHVVLTWGCSDLPAASAALAKQADRYPRWTPLVKEIFGLIRADGLTYSGRAAAGLSLADDLQIKGRWRVIGRITPLGRILPQVEARIAQSRAHALLQLGRPGEAVAALDRAATSAQFAELEELIPSWRGTYDTIMAQVARELGAPDRALTHARLAYTSTLETGFIWGRAWAAYSIAAGHVLLAELDRAQTWAARAAALAHSGNLTDCEHLALAMLCMLHGVHGRPVPAEVAARMNELPQNSGFLHHQRPIGASWRALASGHRALAEQELSAGLRRAQHDGAVAAVRMLAHEWVRQGHPLDGVDRWAVGPADPDNPMASARTMLLQGAASRDAARLERAAELFASHRMPLYAAEAMALAARHSTGREAVARTRRAQALAAGIDAPAAPLLRPLADRHVVDPLTRRERQIAELATSRSNNAIAEQLSLSVRTVETHLARVYTKLGITSRADLSEALNPGANASA